jgi:hypothetical protein
LSNSCKKRIKFQTFLKAWGPKKLPPVKEVKQPKEELKVIKKEELKPVVKLEPKLKEVLKLEVKPEVKPEKLESRVNQESQCIVEKIIIEKPLEKPLPEKIDTISLQQHMDIVKWISILYLVHSIVILILFIILFAVLK